VHKKPDAKLKPRKNVLDTFLHVIVRVDYVTSELKNHD